MKKLKKFKNKEIYLYKSVNTSYFALSIRYENSKIIVEDEFNNNFKLTALLFVKKIKHQEVIHE